MDLTSVTKRMDRFRSRLRSLYLASGVSLILFGLGLLLLLSFVLDYFLDLPIAVRYASCLTALLVLGVVFLRTILYPLSVRLSDDDLALAAEARLPEFQDRLISALQFRRQIEDPENSESPEMMRMVIEEAGRLEHAVELSRLLDAKTVRRHALLAAASFAALLLIAAVAPSAAGTWARRNLLLMDIPWPRATTLVVEGFPESGEKVVTRGESLRIDVRAVGKVPNDVEIRFTRTEGEASEEDRRRMYQTEDEPDLFRFEFRQIPASFRFWVVGGDDTDGEPEYSVLALIPPTIEEIQASCRFPEYSRLEPETFREADLDVPEGTEIALSFGLNMPVRSAVMLQPDREPVPLALSADGRTAKIDLTANRTFEYELRFTGVDGQRSLPASAAFRIRAVPDRKPLVRILHPAARPWHTTKALIPFKVLASDNFGLSGVTLFVKKGAEEEFSPRVFTVDETWAADQGRQLVCYAAIPAAELVTDQENPVRVGDEITYYAEATDNNGNVDRSDRFRIEIVSEEDLERRLSQRQTDLRDDALKSGQKQARAHVDVTALVEFVEGGGALVAADREQLREIQIRQGTVTRDMDQFFSEVSRVFNSYVYNRLAKPSATERILLLFDDFLKADHEELSTVFKRELYESLIAEYRAGRIYDMQILAVLIEIMEIALKVGGQTSPEAHRLLTGLARGEPEKGVAEDLGRVEALQTDILADFRLLDRKMQRWESYAELIEFLRDVKTIQGDVKNGAESILNEGGRSDPK